MQTSQWWKTLVVLTWVCSPSMGQTSTSAGQALRVAPSSAATDALLKGDAANWAPATARKIALNRTPPLYDTDEPTADEISTMDARLLRSGGHLFVQLNWRDNTNDMAKLQGVPNSAPETRFLKVPTEADDRFFDAVAVMVPSQGGVNPSLQMGDASHPVQIFYWNAARGAMVMEAQGRGTTRRTGKEFPASGSYRNGSWIVTLQLPDQPSGTPMAFAVWNGSQKDRDGRKYFSVWYDLE